MNIITKTAIANFKKNKSRNILIGIAIALTTFLLTIVPIAIFGMVDMQLGAVKEIYPTFHGMYRDMPEAAVKEMKEDPQFKNVGVREDLGVAVGNSRDASISMMFMDKNTLEMGKVKLEEGRFPQEADEIVLSKGILKELGKTGGVGDKVVIPYQIFGENGLGLSQEREFTITGMVKDEQQSLELRLYTANVSQAFAEEAIGNGQHTYRVYFQLNVSKYAVTDDMEEQIKEIAPKYKVKEDGILINKEYLSASYVDEGLNLGVAAIMLVVVLAGILTIYSIYYVSMMDKIQEFGRLRAIGATKKQIRRLVFFEGFTGAVLAIPVGMLLGTAGGLAVLKIVITSGLETDNILSEQMAKMFGKIGISLIQPWILCMAAAIAIFTVFISLLKPMQIASKISAIEALRYQGGEKGKKKRRKGRKGYEEMNPRKLAASNLGRNRKRTTVTILTLGVTGIFYMVLATILSCVSPKIMAEEEIRGDIQIEIDSQEGNQEHPEWALRKIQQNNPLNEEMKAQIEAISGVEKMEVQMVTNGGLKEYKEEDGRDFQISVYGMNDEMLKGLKPYLLAGDLEDSRLTDGSGIIFTSGYLQKYSELGVGDKVNLDIQDGEETVSREFVIVAEADAPNAYGGYGFILPDSVLQGACKNNLTYSYSIFAGKADLKAVTKELETLVAERESLEMTTYEAVYKDTEKGIGYMVTACYGMLFVFGLIGILNLVNTMINSVHIRKREIGILQAIGLSDKQNIRMLQLEGLFYTAGTLFLSLGIGSIAGYVCFLAAKKDGAFSIRIYNYPVVPAVILVVVIVLLQLLITWLVNKNMKKESLIDRIRYSD